MSPLAAMDVEGNPTSFDRVSQRRCEDRGTSALPIPHDDDVENLLSSTAAAGTQFGGVSARGRDAYCGKHSTLGSETVLLCRS